MAAFVDTSAIIVVVASHDYRGCGRGFVDTCGLARNCSFDGGRDSEMTSGRGDFGGIGYSFRGNGIGGVQGKPFWRIPVSPHSSPAVRKEKFPARPGVV